MCVSDWRLGRFIKPAFQSQTVINPATFTLQANRQRVGVMVAGDAVQLGGGNSIALKIDGVQVASITQQTPTVLITLANHGDLPTRKIVFDAGLGATLGVGITEFTLPEEFLDDGTKQWQRELMR